MSRTSRTLIAAGLLGAALSGGCASHSAVATTDTDRQWVTVSPGTLAERHVALAPRYMELGAGDMYGGVVYASYLAHLAPREEIDEVRLTEVEGDERPD